MFCLFSCVKENVFIWFFLFYGNMSLALPLVILIVAIVAIWVLVELKRFRHKMFAIFLIFLLVAGYVSFTLSTRGEDIDYKSVSGITHIVKIYFSWLGSLFGNFKKVTSYAIGLDWSEDTNTTKS